MAERASRDWCRCWVEIDLHLTSFRTSCDRFFEARTREPLLNTRMLWRRFDRTLDRNRAEIRSTARDSTKWPAQRARETRTQGLESSGGAQRWTGRQDSRRDRSRELPIPNPIERKARHQERGARQSGISPATERVAQAGRPPLYPSRRTPLRAQRRRSARPTPNAARAFVSSFNLARRVSV